MSANSTPVGERRGGGGAVLKDPQNSDISLPCTSYRLGGGGMETADTDIRLAQFVKSSYERSTFVPVPILVFRKIKCHNVSILYAKGNESVGIIK